MALCLRALRLEAEVSEPLGRELSTRVKERLESWCRGFAYYGDETEHRADVRALLDSHERLERERDDLLGEREDWLVEDSKMHALEVRAEAAEQEVERLRRLLLAIADDATGDWSINPGLNSVQDVLAYIRESAKAKP